VWRQGGCGGEEGDGREEGAAAPFEALRALLSVAGDDDVSSSFFEEEESKGKQKKLVFVKKKIPFSKKESSFAVFLPGQCSLKFIDRSKDN
jgi:hypothetical protein